MKPQLRYAKPLMFFIVFFTSLAYTNVTHAQLFKKLINNIKQPNQSANSNKNTNDTSEVGGVLGAFAKAAQDNPNDTSSADLTMKALGNLTGGGGVSAADSVDAIKTYMSANGGSGTYYEYSIETVSKQAGDTKTTSKMYMAADGEGRSEMNLAAMMGAKNSTVLTIIGRANQPHYSITLDDVNKMYSLNVIDTALISGGFEKYQVTKMGDENIQGYNCIHAKLISTTGSGMFKSSSTMEVWTSVDVPGYSTFKKEMLQNVTPAMMKALDDAGCGGFFVKMTAGDSKDYSMTMLLTKADKQSFLASMFKIPTGYTESKDNLMLGNMMQAAQKQ